MSWRETTTNMRSALKGQGFKQRDVSIVAKSSRISVVIKTHRQRDAADVIAKSWFAKRHAWLFLSLYDLSGKHVFGDLSEGFIPTTVAARIAYLPNVKDHRGAGQYFILISKTLRSGTPVHQLVRA